MAEKTFKVFSAIFLLKVKGGAYILFCNFSLYEMIYHFINQPVIQSKLVLSQFYSLIELVKFENLYRSHTL